MRRAPALLLAAEGTANTRLAQRVRVSATTVRDWRRPFAAGGLKDLGGVYSTQSREDVDWLVAHRRFSRHFTSISSSWLDLVKRWLLEFTDKALRRGVFHSVLDLNAAIEAYQAVNPETHH